MSFCAPDEQHKLAAIISVVGGRVELFEADGTRVEDFKAAGAPSRQRRRGAKPGGRKFAERKSAGRATRPDRSAGGSDKQTQPARKAPHQRTASNDQALNRKTGGAGRRKPDDDGRRTAYAKPHRRKQPSKGGKPNAVKNAAPSAQNLFSKRPKFTSRPNFADSAAPQGSGKNASTNPAGRTEKLSTGKDGRHSSGKSANPDRRDTTARPLNHASHAGKRGNKPGQARAKSSGLGTSKSGTTKSGMSKSGASRSRPGGHGRLKRRASS